MLVLSGALAGLVVGYVLQRSDLCFHAAWRGLFARRFDLARAWILAVAVASLGLTAVYASGAWDGLNRGLAFRPVHNVLGGVMIGVGMVVASSCTSGLFYKLGSGMAGAAVGIGGWALGEVAASRIDVPGPRLIGFGEQATIPGVLGLPRIVVVAAFVVAVATVLPWRRRGSGDGLWGWCAAGIALGLATTGAWVLAGVAGHSFGPSTVGAVAGLVDGRPIWWLTAFLVAMAAGAHAAARASGTWWFRGEQSLRYGQLAAGGALLGAGGIVGGGCNLGHGLSGAAQLNVSSWVVVASILAGIWVSKNAGRLLGRHTPPARWMAVTTEPGTTSPSSRQAPPSERGDADGLRES